MEHRTTTLTLDNIILLHANQGEIEESEKELSTVLAFRTKNLGALHTSTFHSVQHLGELYTKMGKYKDADEMLLRALEGHEEVVGKVHQDYRGACTAYGVLREAQGRFSEAEEFYAEVLSQRMIMFNPKNYYIWEARRDLDRARRAQGLPTINTNISLSFRFTSPISPSSAHPAGDSATSDQRLRRGRRDSQWGSGNVRRRTRSVASLGSPSPIQNTFSQAHVEEEDLYTPNPSD